MTDFDVPVNRLQTLVHDSPTSFHAAAAAATMLQGAGFTRLDERQAWPSGPGNFVVVRDGAFLAWRVPAGADALTPFSVIGSHTDSPGFRVKPTPDSIRDGWRVLNTEVYGGPLANSWLDRDLRIGARLLLRDGSTRLVVTGPVARIPQLAVHLDRAVNADGVKLDRQQHLRAVLGLETSPGALDLLAEAGGVNVDEVVGMDAYLADAQAPERIGAESDFLASARLDNLVSVSAGLGALISVEAPETITMLAGFDHEEVGSESRSGAAGPFLGDVMERISAGLGADALTRHRALAASWCVSSDVGHSVHPNYPERHDDAVRPMAGAGPILKINASQRYATDGAGEALWRRCSEAAGVAVQAFVSRNSIPSGSTIGPITATRLGIRTVDVGIPILSMHSARELAAVSDIEGLEAVLAEFCKRPSETAPVE